MPDLAVIIPTRGRPENIRKVIAAWEFTNAWTAADMILAVDADDPGYQEYVDLLDKTFAPVDQFKIYVVPEWRPMVHKMNEAARTFAMLNLYEALGFAGDDHLPQTIGWAERYLTVLRELGTGMVFGDDGYQGSNLSTEWAVTADAVRALGRMVPAPVEHMYCDNSMMDLFGGAGALRHLPEVRIEHMHPIAGKAENDDQYKRVNHRDQFKRDRTAYESWQRSGMATDIRTIRALRPGRAEIRPSSAEVKPDRKGLLKRSTPPRPKGSTMSRYGIPRHFKRVVGATPDEIGVTLADFARQVPADQAIVELGVYQGRTALLMGWGARQGNAAHVYGVDAWNLPGNTYGPPFNEAGSKAWADYHVMALGYGKDITLIQDFAIPCADAWEGPEVGLLFVDDDHSKAGALGAILAWAPHLADGAVIAIDDYGHPDWPGVAEAVDELVSTGVLAPIEIFHDRLAVTRLMTSAAGDPVPVLPPHTGVVQAVTSEGVLPSPYPAAEDQVAVPAQMIESSVHQTDRNPEVRNDIVLHGELGSVEAGTSIDDLNLGQLRALARARGIVLGRRKDLRADVTTALKDGK